MAQAGNYIVGSETDYRSLFKPADTVATFHSLPRFSHHDDFSALFASEPEEVTSYTTGLLFVACLIMSFFSVWGLLLLLFKCLGPANLGILSGYPYQKEGIASRVGRFIFLISALMVMIFSILAVIKGLTKLEDTTDTIDLTNQDVIKIHDEFLSVTASLKTVSRQATPVRDQLVEFLNGDICPLVPDGNADIRVFAQEALDALEQLANFISDELTSVTNALKQVAIATREVNTAVEQVQFTSGAAVGVMIPYFIVPALLLVTLVMGWTETYVEGYYCFTTWFTLPVFIIMVIFTYVACGFTILATESNADFCYGGTENTPEATIANIMGRYNLTQGDMYYDAIKFYSNQCTIEGPWSFLEDYFGDLVRAKTSLAAIATAITQVSPESISQACGVDYSPVLQLINQLATHTTILTDATERSLELLSCDSIVPLYTSTVYNTMCQNNMTAATWIFSCALVMSFFGMLLITFRGAYYPFFIWEGKDDYSTEDSDLDLEEVVSGNSHDDEDEYVDGSQSILYLDETGSAADAPTSESAAEEYDGSTFEESEHFEEEEVVVQEDNKKRSSRRRK